MTSKQSDFFNLDSTSSEDSDGEKLQEKIKEWDWDAPENRDDSDNEGSSNNDTKLLYRLNGHKSSVNRVHWCKRYDMRNFLLSSSMDR